MVSAMNISIQEFHNEYYKAMKDLSSILTEIHCISPCRRVLVSDWFINNFVMIAYENFFSHTLERKV